MEHIEFTTPDFLFCEIPIKDGSFNDQRTWVYHTKSLSLIEIIYTNNLITSSIKTDGTGKYINSDNLEENYILAFVQDNTEVTNNNRTEVLKNAWIFFKNYLKWQDKEIDKN